LDRINYTKPRLKVLYSTNQACKYFCLITYEKALEFKPDDHQAWYNRGNALADLGHNEEAIESYDKALEFKPDYHQAWYGRGNALLNSCVGYIPRRLRRDFKLCNGNRRFASKTLSIPRPLAAG
jgi:tetratricopeptide (TPR) repeat protein